MTTAPALAIVTVLLATLRPPSRVPFPPLGIVALLVALRAPMRSKRGARRRAARGAYLAPGPGRHPGHPAPRKHRVLYGKRWERYGKRRVRRAIQRRPATTGDTPGQIPAPAARQDPLLWFLSSAPSSRLFPFGLPARPAQQEARPAPRRPPIRVTSTVRCRTADSAAGLASRPATGAR
jgi:hypothetical protein